MMTRRQMLAACSASVPALCSAGRESGSAGRGSGSAGRGSPDPAHTADRRSPTSPELRLGVVLYVYSIRLADERARGVSGLADPLAFLDYCHKLGAGGIQTAVGRRDAEYVAELRRKLEAYGMYLEGIVALPRDRADVERFTAEVRTAKEAGARVVRTTLMNGRRYEVFDSAAAYRRAKEQARAALALAEPVVARLDVRLAIENHKDLRTAELVEVLRKLGSAHVGACVDTGNGIALLEDPMEVVEALAPWAFTTHLKDMAVAEYEDGFLLAEVPLGEGILDLPRVVGALRKARPEVRLNLEMITRDPLRVPCLTPKYWTTADDVPGRDLARTLAMARRQKPARPLRRVSHLPPKERLAVEDENARKSLAYARKHLSG